MFRSTPASTLGKTRTRRSRPRILACRYAALGLHAGASASAVHATDNCICPLSPPQDFLKGKGSKPSDLFSGFKLPKQPQSSEPEFKMPGGGFGGAHRHCLLACERRGAASAGARLLGSTIHSSENLFHPSQVVVAGAAGAAVTGAVAAAPSRPQTAATARVARSSTSGSWLPT